MLNWLNRYSYRVLAVLIAGYVLVFGVLSCQKLAYFRQGFDMAGNEQTIWNTLHGRPFQISVFAMMRYDFDDGPVFLQIPLALLYGMYQSPYTLLILQTLALGLAAIPLFFIVRSILPQAWQALAVAAIYLLHPTTQHINMYEFQLRSFMIPFALSALLFLRREKVLLYTSFLLLMLFTKTEAGFTLVAFGIYALILRKRWYYAAIPLILGPIWVGVALGVIVPAYSEGDFITKIYSYGKLGASVGDVIKTMLTNPALAFQVMTEPPKVKYVLQLFGLGGFLALFSPTVILALPVLALNLISPNAVQFSLNYQYGALVYPFLIVASVEGLINLARWLGFRTKSKEQRADEEHRTKNIEHKASDAHFASRITSVGIVALFVMMLVGSLTLNNAIKTALSNREPAQRVADARAIVAAVPPDASVAASTFLAPHLAQRREIYFFPGNNSYPAEYVDRAEYLVFDRRPPANNDKLREAIKRYLNDPNWQIVQEHGDFILLKQTKVTP
ncbi:MAG: DUF2079 domain-containing protein [Herpetosiphon sp.]|nr:DUF2079 domain-containing protein [Herpetosiphon sp.]